jgi:hypothetical protein
MSVEGVADRASCTLHALTVIPVSPVARLTDAPIA